MSVFENAAFDGHEAVSFFTDEATGLRAIIAVHSTTLGPGAGGTRLWTYPSSAEALTDVLRLSRGMSFKNAMADLPLGGGKAVILRPEGDFDRTALFEAYGRCVDAMGGSYITAEDVGVSVDDMRAVRRSTKFVGGLPGDEDGSGDPSVVTARGVFMGLLATAKRALGSEDLTGVTVAVQGVGHVGASLCGHLHNAGAKLIVTDIDEGAVADMVARYGARAVAPDDIYDQDADIFAPCALGAVINPKTIGRFNVKAIAGAANNVLATEEMGEALKERGILFAPDYVINGGGIINVASEIAGDYDAKWVETKLLQLRTTLEEIFTRAADEGRPTNAIADQIAKDRIAACKRASERV